MVRKETCPRCKGNRYVSMPTPSNTQRMSLCPECGGQGYKIRVVK